MGMHAKTMSKQPYSALLLDRLISARSEAWWMPDENTVPFDCTSVLPLAVDHFERKSRRLNGRLCLTRTAIPPAPPPYPSAWYEWLESDKHVRFGVLVGSRDVSPAERQLSNSPPVRGARWVQSLVPFLYDTQSHLWNPSEVFHLSLVDETGKVLGSYVHDVATGEPSHDGARGGVEGGAYHSGGLGAACYMAQFFQGILACKNTERVTVEPPEKLSRARVRRGGLPLQRHHTLRVKIPGTNRYVDMEEVQRINEGGHVGLYTVMGHFKTYTAEKPLLGRHTGTWYWPPMFRGNPKKGIITKDYLLEPGADAK